MSQQILLFIDNDADTRILKKVLANRSLEIISDPTAYATLYNLAEKIRPDIIVIALNSTNPEIMTTAQKIMTEHPAPIIMFVNEGDADTATEATRIGISAYVIDGLRENRIIPILSAAITRFNEKQALLVELATTQKNLRDRKLIERAKGLLMKQRGNNEDEAYKALRKIAMDKNLRLGQVAENVITVNELMN